MRIRRLSETIQYCLPLIDASRSATCLRTLPLDPNPFLPRYLRVEWLAAERARRVAEVTTRSLPNDDAQSMASLLRFHGGRIFVFLPDLYLYENMEPSECGGYIDNFGSPPIDTWLFYVEDFPDVPGGGLLSWVPDVFVAGVQRAISVNPSSAMLWLEDLPGDLAMTLMKGP